MLETLDPTLPPDSSSATHDLGGLLGVIGGREAAFPLREVRVRAAIAADCCRTVIEQAFDNPYDTALEAVHIFPLPPDAAVIEMELVAGETTVRAECREREAAVRVFDEARQSGRRAALLTAERADVHTLRVTNIPPATAVRVRFVVVQRLEQADGAFAWRFPTVIAPRYLPGTPAGDDGVGVLPNTDAAPDASRLQPPLRLGGGARLDLEVEIAGPLASLASSLHAVRTTLGGVVRVAPSGRATLDRDFVLRFAPATTDAHAIRTYTDGNYTLAVVAPTGDVEAPRVPRDIVLVVDVSGSMEGEKLRAATRAMSAVLHGLEKGDRFRLIAFESTVHPHTSAFLPFDQPSLEQADRWIAALHPLGGTEMLPALKEAFAGDTPAGRLRTVIFITDGQAWNEEQLAAAVERQRAGAILFTIGIDTAVNESLLRRLARVGHGTCELLTPADDIEEAIASLEARFGAPLLTDLVPTSLEAARPQPVHLFAGQAATLLLRGSATALRLRGIGPDSRPVHLVAPEPVRVSFPLGALWAREHVAWLEDRIASDASRETELRNEIVAVALEHHIASRFTAFVAVEERVSSTGERVTVVQPVELPSAWSDAFLEERAGTPLTLRCMAPAEAPRAEAPSRTSAVMRGVFEPLLSRLPGIVREGRVPSAGGEPPHPPRPASRSTRDVRRDIETALATSQDADGSYEGSVERTAAALVALVRLGHTRHAGTRRRVVQKCARWLGGHHEDARARLALDLLARAESRGDLPHPDDVRDLLSVAPEGGYLRAALDL